MNVKDQMEHDQNDPLRSFRKLFHLPKGVIYLDGNSLGPAPLKVFQEMETVLRQEWAEDLIQSWNSANWWD